MQPLGNHIYLSSYRLMCVPLRHPLSQLPDWQLYIYIYTYIDP